MGWYGYGWHPYGYGFGAFSVLWWILGIIVLIALLRWAFGWRRHRFDRWSTSSPLDILKERYAKGEINKEEFEAKKKDLGL